MQTHFWQQANNFPSVSYIGLALSDGTYIGAQTQKTGETLLELVDDKTQGNLETWATDKQTQLSEHLKTRANYDPRKRPWYISAVESEQPTWSDIHIYFSGTSVGLSAQPSITQSKKHKQ